MHPTVLRSHRVQRIVLRPSAMRLQMFDRIGLTNEQEALYRLLIAEPQLPLPSVARRLSLSAEAIESAVSRLESLGLIRRTPSGDSLAVTDPEAAFELLIRDQLHGLDAVRAESARLGRQLRQAQQASNIDALIEVLVGAEAIGARWEHAQATAQQGIRMTDRPPYYAGAKIEGMNVQLRRMAEGFSYQVLYDARVLEEAYHLRRAQAAIAAGEQARVAASVPIKLAIVDESHAFVVLLSSGDAHEPTVIIVYASALLDSLIELFDLLWVRSVALPSQGTPRLDGVLSEDQQALIALLATGLKDEAIAHELGVTARTVRRRIQTLYDLLGVRNRFQAGVALKARGWL